MQQRFRPTRSELRAAMQAIRQRGEPVTLSRMCKQLRMARRTINRALDRYQMKRFPPGRPLGTATERSWGVTHG